MAEQGQVGVGVDFLARVEVELLCVGEPKGASGLGVEVPLDDGADVGVEGYAGSGRFCLVQRSWALFRDGKEGVAGGDVEDAVVGDRGGVHGAAQICFE